MDIFSNKPIKVFLSNFWPGRGFKKLVRKKLSRLALNGSEEYQFLIEIKMSYQFFGTLKIFNSRNELIYFDQARAPSARRVVSRLIADSVTEFEGGDDSEFEKDYIKPIDIEIINMEKAV